MKEVILTMTMSYYKQGEIEVIDKIRTHEQCNVIGKKWFESIQEDISKDAASFVCVEVDRYD